MTFIMFWHDFVHLVIWELFGESGFIGKGGGEVLTVCR